MTALTLIFVPAYRGNDVGRVGRIYNPLRFTDPSGFVALDNCDWFVNSTTGDVYYNSELQKGDEDRIEGEGWEHFAENGKLNASGEESVDLNILLANQDLTDDLNVKKAGKVMFPDGQIVSSFSAEATFKGADAKELMSGQGYKQVPLTYKLHSDVSTEYHPPEGWGQIEIPDDRSRMKTLTVQYVSKSSHLRETQILKDYGKIPYSRSTKSHGVSYSVREQTWTVRKDIYGSYPNGEKTKNIIKWIDDNLPWQGYYESFWEKIINKKK